MKSLFAWFLILTTSIAQAGEFYEKNGFALGDYDPVSYFKNNAPQKGDQSIRTTYRGSVFLFLSVQKKWLKDTKSYIDKAQKNWPSVTTTTKVY